MASHQATEAPVSSATFSAALKSRLNQSQVLRPVVDAVLRHRLLVIIPVHIGVLSLSFLLAFQLRFDGAVPPKMHLIFLQTLPLVLCIKLLALHWLASFHGWWRFVNFADLVGLIRANAVASMAIISFDYFLITEWQIPRSVVAIDFCLTVLLIGGLRGMSRFFREHVHHALHNESHQRAFVIGAESGGESLIRELHASTHLNYRVVGFLEDDPQLRGLRVAGVPVLGTIDELLALSQKHLVGRLLVISQSLPGEKLLKLAEQCAKGHVDLKMIPSVDEMLAGRFQMRIREVNINDLLRREAVQLDDKAVGEMIRGRRVMVTGAGGSIGSEICRQVVRCAPNKLILVERAENSLFSIEQELLNLPLPVDLAPRVADIREEARMEQVFDEDRPEIVFHAAAHKHVPLMESNPGQAVYNNVFGTKVVADLACKYEVDRFVLISTDKAVQPTSVMGATKQLAERYVRALSDQEHATRYMAVRFGNVLGSDGSVVPTFAAQIRRGGPVTITHPLMQRYFMTIPEASELVLQAAAIGSNGAVFVLDMGKPIRITDLARDMIRLSGHADDEIKIEVTGMRPGEKLVEVLHTEREEMIGTRHPRILSCRSNPPAWGDVLRDLEVLQEVFNATPDEVRNVLRMVVSDYDGQLPADTPQGELDVAIA